jgi:hypothetical protein
MTLIAFAIMGIVEVAPNVCQIDYMRYVDVASVKLPCDVVKLNIIDNTKSDVIR